MLSAKKGLFARSISTRRSSHILVVPARGEAFPKCTVALCGVGENGLGLVPNGFELVAAKLGEPRLPEGVGESEGEAN